MTLSITRDGLIKTGSERFLRQTNTERDAMEQEEGHQPRLQLHQPPFPSNPAAT